MKPRIIMVTGGQRSGKSELAERLTLAMGARPVYLATAQVRDEEMERRVAIHRARRGPEWTTVEAPLFPSRCEGLAGRVVLMDCLTLLATNHFLAADCDAERARAATEAELDGLARCGAEAIVVVTNEIGLGGISADAMQRAFTDLQGYVNAHLARLADEAYMCVSGLSIKLK